MYLMQVYKAVSRDGYTVVLRRLEGAKVCVCVRERERAREGEREGKDGGREGQKCLRPLAPSSSLTCVRALFLCPPGHVCVCVCVFVFVCVCVCVFVCVSVCVVANSTRIVYIYI
jgi:hypothetical protein